MREKDLNKKKGIETGRQAGEKSELFLEPSLGGEIFKSISHIKEVPRLPLNSLFVAVQLIGNKETVEFGKGNKMYYVSFGNYSPKTAREKALFMSVYYALVYYATKDIDKILLTDLMENIGYPKRIGHGYLEYQKEEVLEMVWNVAKSEIGISGTSAPQSIKRLFPGVEKKDVFKINIFNMNIVKQYTISGTLKNAVILFKANFNGDIIRFNSNSKVIRLPISEPEYKNLAIYIVYGSNFKNTEKITKTVREALEIAKIDIDRIHPERTYNKLLFALRKIKADGYIDRWEWTTFPDIRDIEKGEYRGDRGWFDRWLDSKVVVVLPNKI
jgi:hypothetical protein